MKKRILILGGVILLGVIWVLFCFIYKKVKYDSWIEADEKYFQAFEEKRIQNNGKSGDRITTAAASKDLWEFTGNLAISMTNYFDEDGNIINDTVDLMIFPHFISGFDTIVSITPASGASGVSFCVNEDMSLIDEEYREWYEKYYDDILKDFELAHEVFGIYEVPQR